ncbi:hypothetical protein GCM10027030_10150 [Luteococcus sediminum]
MESRRTHHLVAEGRDDVVLMEPSGRVRRDTGGARLLLDLRHVLWSGNLRAAKATLVQELGGTLPALALELGELGERDTRVVVGFHQVASLSRCSGH